MSVRAKARWMNIRETIALTIYRVANWIDDGGDRVTARIWVAIRFRRLGNIVDIDP